MTTINTYLTFNGNCEIAFNFYQKVFGGEFVTVSRFKDMPESPEFKITEEYKERIMHITLPISKETLLMGSDTGGEWAASFKPGNNFSISISTDLQKEADRLFAELAEGGQVMMPMAKTFWGSYFGMFTDQFGIQWMISFGQE